MFSALFFTSSDLMAARMNEVQWTFESFLFGEQAKVAETELNPGNAVFQQAHMIHTLDNRLEFKWLINDAKVIARPRWILTQHRFKNDLTEQEKASEQGRLELSDGFIEQVLNRKLSLTGGLQVYQWGPGELFNPSNPFFRFNNRQQTFTFKEKGKVLARLNYSFDMERSLVLITEPISNRETYWLEGYEFKPQAALKFEKNWKNTRNYYGLIGGFEAQQNPFIGEYAHYEIKPGFSMYLDAKHGYELPYYGPTPNAFGSFDMELRGEKNREWSHLALLGVRYEGNVDFRVEYLHNSAGLNQADYDAAIASASNFLTPKYGQNVARFALSGLNLMTQNYLYLSLRIMEPGTIRDFNFYFRTLNSVLDHSGLVQAEFDKGIGDSFVGFGSYTLFSGKKNSEFHLLDDWKALIGLKYTM
ncbi:MAG: hypothetical protein ACXWC9_09335 [Pseudobdellovibrionaceae bacterium]